MDLTDKDIELVQVDPFSAGYFDREVEKGRRLVSAVSYWREDLKDNGYAHPIEGVVALVDLIEQQGGRPRRRTRYRSDPAKNSATTIAHSIPIRATDIKPLRCRADGWPELLRSMAGRSTGRTGHSASGFTAREGLVLHQIAYRDGGRERPIIYRASVTEMVVPYADPTANHFWKCAFDAGEYGLGKLANALELGCDCLGHIHYFDVPVADDYGKPMRHEERHLHARGGLRHPLEALRIPQRRRSRCGARAASSSRSSRPSETTITASTGTSTRTAPSSSKPNSPASSRRRPIAPGKPYPWGGMVADNLGGPTHQHFFNARLHMMLDGDGNTVTEHEFVPRPWGTDNPYGNVFDTTTRVLSRERDAGREADGRDRPLLEDHQSEREEQRRQSAGLQARGAQRAADAGAGGLLHALARQVCHQACLGDALRAR